MGADEMPPFMFSRFQAKTSKFVPGVSYLTIVCVAHLRARLGERDTHRERKGGEIEREQGRRTELRVRAMRSRCKYQSHESSRVALVAAMVAVTATASAGAGTAAIPSYTGIDNNNALFAFGVVAGQATSCGSVGRRGLAAKHRVQVGRVALRMGRAFVQLWSEHTCFRDSLLFCVVFKQSYISYQ